MEYNEDDFLMLSGIQHFAFCRRQWALIHIEQLWQDNIRTAEGDQLHRNCHDGYSSESRGEVKISRGLPVFSRTLGLSGECDIVEFRSDKNGVSVFGRDGLYQVYPVEYKRGEPKEGDADLLQLAAQSLCLEQMLLCRVEKGAIYYLQTRRRLQAEITDELKQRVREMAEEMHELYRRRYIPKVKPGKHCNACSLKELCMPKLMKHTDIGKYISESVREKEGDESEEVT